MSGTYFNVVGFLVWKNLLDAKYKLNYFRKLKLLYRTRLAHLCLYCARAYSFLCILKHWNDTSILFSLSVFHILKLMLPAKLLQTNKFIEADAYNSLEFQCNCYATVNISFWSTDKFLMNNIAHFSFYTFAYDTGRMKT